MSSALSSSRCNSGNTSSVFQTEQGGGTAGTFQVRNQSLADWGYKNCFFGNDYTPTLTNFVRVPNVHVIFVLFTCVVLLSAGSSFAQPGFARQVNTDKVIEQLRDPSADLTILCAHRGLHDLPEIAENSRASIQRAADMGFECSEIDIKMGIHQTADELVLSHDETLGRSTDVGAVNGLANWDPYTLTGYNPDIATYPFSFKQLHLRSEDFRTTEETLPNLEDILDYIRQNHISMVLMLDIREIVAARLAWTVVKRYTDAWGTPAYKWVIFKMNSRIFPTPYDLEKAGIFDFKTEWDKFLFIPTFFTSSIDMINNFNSFNAYKLKPYVVATEVEEKQDNGFFWDLMIQQKHALRPGYGTFQPVPVSKFHNYISSRGICCENLSQYLSYSKKQNKRETVDSRPDINWIIKHDYIFIITDDAWTAYATLEKVGRRAGAWRISN